MRWLASIFLLSILLLLTWLANVAHLGVVVPPAESRNGQEEASRTNLSAWYPKETHGVNHAFLVGDSFERGYAWGKLTKPLLVKQEQALADKLDELIPSRFVQRALFLFAKRWFWGIDPYIEDEWKREMYGVSLSAPEEFRSLGEPYLRQVAYHGLHEVGQMFVDYGDEGFACTVLAVPNGKSWLVGRNLDFEAGRIFDEEKVLKWVYPEHGNPFVSVIWSGMVGAVTGVNSKGVYISINAAGSEDFARLGTPSTFILLKALQYSSTAEEALEIFRKEKTIITEIFVVSAPGSPFYVIEKSPGKMVVAKHDGPTAVANHLLDPVWSKDKVNEFRRTDLTSSTRLSRGTELVNELAAGKSRDPSLMVLALRDKRVGGELLPGNRSAIDALIATHSVVYDSASGTLFVSKGPSLSGEFLGYDLAKSFAQRKPVATRVIPADKDVNPARYTAIKGDLQLFGRIVNDQNGWDCDGFTELLRGLRGSPTEHYLKYMAIGLVEDRCIDGLLGKGNWVKASALKPAYARERKVVQEHGGSCGWGVADPIACGPN